MKCRGLCRKHYDRLRRRGSVELQKRGCDVPGCTRPHRRNGLCALHDSRARNGRALDAPPQRTRGHHEAMRDMASRLVRLQVCQSFEEAVQLVSVIWAWWPGSPLAEASWSYEADGPGGVDLRRLHA